MKNNHAVVFYVIIIALALAGAALLFLRQPFIEALRNQTGISTIDVTVRRSAPASELLDTAILADPRMTALKNNVNVFVFDEVCGESVNSVKRCVKGNNKPF
ncbi:MAG: hypothetical protein HY931_02345 [Candidatus Falkowbacteria bacterium]|nr:MAG: hypothetical protein HY931_02345 [Candidatus Falkowbacteria bacterium]